MLRYPCPDHAAPTAPYTLSLHDALPISPPLAARSSGDRAQGRPYTSDPYHCQPVVAETGRLRSKSTRLNSSHVSISYAVFCLKKKQEVLDLLLPSLAALVSHQPPNIIVD